MAFNEQAIIIDKRRVRIVDSGGDQYDDTVAITESISAFEALPGDVVRYERKMSGQEFWIRQVGDSLKQESPSVAYMDMVRLIGNDLPALIQANEAARLPTFSSDLDELATAYQGIPFTFNIFTTVALPVTANLVLDNTIAPPIIHELNINVSPYEVQIIFANKGAFNVLLDAIQLSVMEVL